MCFQNVCFPVIEHNRTLRMATIWTTASQLGPVLLTSLFGLLIVWLWQRRGLYAASWRMRGPIAWPLFGNALFFWDIPSTSKTQTMWTGSKEVFRQRSCVTCSDLSGRESLQLLKCEVIIVQTFSVVVLNYATVWKVVNKCTA